METIRYGIVLFNTTQAAIKAEKVLKTAGIKIKLIPVPRYISSNCGASIRFDMALAGEVKALLDANSVPIMDIRQLE